jgi:hypothetical protein
MSWNFSGSSKSCQKLPANSGIKERVDLPVAIDTGVLEQPGASS